MGAVRLELRLSSQSEWFKIFDPRDFTVTIPSEEAHDAGTSLRIDLDVGGWRVTLRGTVVGMRDEPASIVVALGAAEREKINYLSGFMRGGLLNLREKRRLPLRLSVTYGAIEGPATTVTRDINEEGLFLLTDRPLPETSQVHMLVTVPGKPQPLSLVGKVSHTILEADEEPPGMGIVFELDDAGRAQLAAVIQELEQALQANTLPDPIVE